MEPSINKVPSQRPRRKGSQNPLVSIANAMFGKKAEEIGLSDENFDLEMTNEFQDAAHKLEDIKKFLVGDEWLRAYSLFKQATEGDCKSKKPSKMFKTRYLKHDYWAGRQGMSKEKAAERYIGLVAEYEKEVSKRTKNGAGKVRRRKDLAKSKTQHLKASRKGSAGIPLSVEEAPESFEEKLFVVKPKKKYSRGRASVEFNKFLSRRPNSTGAAFSEDNFLLNFASADQGGGANSFMVSGKKSQILLAQQSIRASVRNRYIPSEAEFQRFTLVRNSTVHTATSFATFDRPDYKYKGPSLKELVNEGIKNNDRHQSQSVHLDESKIDAAYHDVLPVIHLLKVEYLREMDKNPVQINPKDKEAHTMLSIPLDKFIFRLVRYLDRWFDESANINSPGARSLIITKFYIENKIKQSIDDFGITKLNIHKLLAVCMLLSAKYCEDCLIANSYWAQVSGMTVKQLNEFEELILDATDFDLYVSNEDITKTGLRYHLHMDAVQKSPPVKNPNVKFEKVTG